MKRRSLMLGSVAALAPLASGRADAPWPAKTIRYISPFSPGGGTDTVSRLLCDQLSRILGQQIIVDNKAGAGGNIGTAEMAHAAPDGYTIGLISVASHAINPVFYARMPYDPDRDIVAISLIASLPNLLGVSKSLPAANVPELIALCRKDPGKYSYASSGPGSSLHLCGELFKMRAGVDIVHVPYKGAGAAYQDLISGQVQVMFGNMPGMLTQVRGNNLRGLAVTSLERSRMAPELPAIAETLPGYQGTSWYGVGAPAATPEPIVARLEAAIGEALAQPGMQARFFELGLDIPPLGRAGLNAFIARERALWAPVVKAPGARAE